MTAPRFTAAEKHDAARREVGMRRRVFPRRVAEGRMTDAESRRQIEIMEEIARDYGEQADREAKAGRLI